MAGVACGCSPTVGRATRLVFGGACAGCEAAVRALRSFSGRPLRTPSRVAFLLSGRSQYNNLWPRVAIKTKCEISIHSYRCRQSELYRPSLPNRRRFATYDFAHTEWATHCLNSKLCLVFVNAPLITSLRICTTQASTRLEDLGPSRIISRNGTCTLTQSFMH